MPRACSAEAVKGKNRTENAARHCLKVSSALDAALWNLTKLPLKEEGGNSIIKGAPQSWVAV